MPNMLNRIPLNALRSFEAAARHLSFVDAAEELGVTPSAVSMQVRKLEEQIGRPLFVRSHRGIALSETGERLAPRLRQLFGDMDDLLTNVVAPQSLSLRITAMPSFAAKWLAPRLSRFNAMHPNYRVRIEGSDALLDFDRDDADIGLRYGRGDYPGLFAEKLASVAAFPVCSPEFFEAHREALSTPQGLLTTPLLFDEIAGREPGLPTWEAWFTAAGVVQTTNQPGLLFESLHMALAAAQAGQGVALALSPIVEDDLAHHRLMRLFDIAIASPYAFWLVCRRGRENERKIAAFRRWVASETNAVA